MTALQEGMRGLLASRRRELDRGAAPVGWKIGINVEAVQARLGLDGPVVGHLTSAGLVEDGAVVRVGRWANPMLEPEVAIRVGADGAPAGLAPAIELVDIDIPLEDLEQILRRNVFHRNVILGAETTAGAPERVRCEVALAGEVMATADAPFDAREVVSYVSGFLERHGAELHPGDWIIAGSLTTPAALTAAGRVEVSISDLGRVAVGVEI